MTITIDPDDLGATRTSLGLGTASTKNTGTGNGDVPVLDATGLPALNASQLTALNAANLTGTIPDGRFPATLPAASAANLTSLPAANISGVIPSANLGSGTANASTFLNGSGAFSAAGGGGCWVKKTSGTFSNVANVDFTSLPDHCRITILFTANFGNPLSARVSSDNGSSFHTSTYRFVETDLISGLTGFVQGSTDASDSQGLISMGATNWAEIFWQNGQSSSFQTLISWRIHAVQGAQSSNQGDWTNIGHGLRNVNETHNALRIFQAGNSSGSFCVDEFTT
jgi:hypothetical protein